MISSTNLPNVSASNIASSPAPSEAAAVDRQPGIERMEESGKSENAGSGAQAGGTDALDILKKVMKAVEDIMSSIAGAITGGVQSVMSMFK